MKPNRFVGMSLKNIKSDEFFYPTNHGRGATHGYEWTGREFEYYKIKPVVPFLASLRRGSWVVTVAYVSGQSEQ
jgi:hypothetical protein